MIGITIVRDAEDAVYAQVARQVRHLVASGAIEPGTSLPSVRHLARDLGVSLNTIARAYRLLEDEGFLVIRDRAGVVVAPPAGEMEDGTRSGLIDELQVVLARLRQAGMPPDDIVRVVRDEVASLDGGQPGEGP